VVKFHRQAYQDELLEKRESSMNADPNLPKTESTTMPAPPESSQDDGLRSLTRLVVGAVGIGIEELSLRLRRWEEELDRAKAKEKTKSSQPPAQSATDQPEGTEPESDQLLRFAMTGMLFDAQVIVKRGVGKAVKVGRGVRRRTSPIIRPIASSRLLSPVRTRYRKMVSIGQQRLDRWIEIGRQEETHSRMLAQTALAGTVDETVDYLAEMPGVQELIATQGTSIIGEIGEEIRERTVAADIVLEGFARSIFRRKPRYKLPPPPPAVQNSAVSLRSTKIYINTSRKG
jgi:hypothetical protein